MDKDKIRALEIKGLTELLDEFELNLVEANHWKDKYYEDYKMEGYYVRKIDELKKEFIKDLLQLIKTNKKGK